MKHLSYEESSASVLNTAVRTIIDVGFSVGGSGIFTDALTAELERRKIKIGPNLSLLEVGCGCGKLGYYYAQFGARYVGLDIDERQLAYARLVASIANKVTNLQPDVTYVEGDAHSISPFLKSDVVFSEGVLEHFQVIAQQSIVHEMAEAARKLIIIFVPNAENPAAVRRAEESVHSYKGMPEKEQPLFAWQLNALLREAGLKDIQVREVNEMLMGAGVK